MSRIIKPSSLAKPRFQPAGSTSPGAVRSIFDFPMFTNNFIEVELQPETNQKNLQMINFWKLIFWVIFLFVRSPLSV